jgi:hypothetical protein
MGSGLEEAVFLRVWPSAEWQGQGISCGLVKRRTGTSVSRKAGTAKGWNGPESSRFAHFFNRFKFRRR